MKKYLKNVYEYLYYEHGYWLFDWVLPAIGWILFFGIIAFLVLKFVAPITVDLVIEIEPLTN